MKLHLLQNINAIFTKSWFQYFCCVLFAFALLGFSPKTNDSEWMGVYPLPDFPPLDTGIPVIRFLIPIEQFEYFLTGNLWFTQNFLYAFCYSIIFYILVKDGIVSKHLFRLFVMLIPVVLGLTFAAVGGPLYDAVFTLALVLSLKLINEVENITSAKQLVLIGLTLTLLDLSRPNGLFFAIIFILILFVKVKTRIYWSLIPIFVLALPWHLVQFVRFGTFTLTTYQGQNYAEAFNWQGVFAGSRDCLLELGRASIDSQAFQSCSAFNQKFIIEELLANPVSLKYVLHPEHVLSIIFPDPFWHSTGFLQGNSTIVSLVTTVVISGLATLFIYWMTQFQLNKRYLLASLIFIIGIATGIVAHNGTESIRLAIPFYFVLVWGLTNTKINVFASFETRKMRNR